MPDSTHPHTILTSAFRKRILVWKCWNGSNMQQVCLFTKLTFLFTHHICHRHYILLLNKPGWSARAIQTIHYRNRRVRRTETQDHNDKHSENDWDLTEAQKTRALLMPLLVLTSVFSPCKTSTCSPKTASLVGHRDSVIYVWLMRLTAADYRSSLPGFFTSDEFTATAGRT